jgi:hypothetical protein
MASMETMLAVAAVVLLGLGAGACGGATRDAAAGGSSGARTSMTTRTGDAKLVSPYARWDHDGDFGPNDGEIPNSEYDGDDGAVRDYGHAAVGPDRRAVTALIGRYYAALAADDGAAACSLLDASLVRALVEERGPSASSSEPDGEACAVAMSKLLTRTLGRAPADLSDVTVIGVRVEGDEGLALLRLRSAEVRNMPVSREGGVWKVDAYLDNGLG